MWQGPGPGESVPELHPDVAAYLVEFAKDARSVDRANQTFYAFDAFGPAGLEIQMPSEKSIHVAERDIRTLAESGYIVAEHFNTQGTFDFYVTDAGFYAADDYGGAPDTFEHVEEVVLRSLDSDDFRGGHPEAFAKWQGAARMAASDPVANATKIGHDCREAMQHFATSMLAKVGVTSSAPATRTVDRLREVVNARRGGLGAKEVAFLDALVHQWGTVSDLVQRQEHGAQKGGSPLTALDSERVVRQTAIVMFELDNAIV